MKLTFSQARKRREQLVMHICELTSMGAMAIAAGFTLMLILHNL